MLARLLKELMLFVVVALVLWARLFLDRQRPPPVD
jgi:hypothetical protein